MFNFKKNGVWLEKALQKYHHILKLGQSRTRSKGMVSGQKPGLRSDFKRFIWGAIFLVIYFQVISNYSDDGQGSRDNYGLIATLIGAIVVAGLGAFFAPRLTEYLQAMTPRGNRDKARDLSAHLSKNRRHSRRRSQSSQSESVGFVQADRDDGVSTNTTGSNADESVFPEQEPKKDNQSQKI